MSVFVCWKETKQRFVRWDYKGGGVQEPVFEEIETVKRALWSNETTCEQITKAWDYVRKERPEAWVEAPLQEDRNEPADHD